MAYLMILLNNNGIFKRCLGMIGIYKITNKNNNKSYIGQSIHCGKRLDEHIKGRQFIDNTIENSR